MKSIGLKKEKLFLVGLVFIFICILPFGMAYAASDWTYEVNGGEATITAYSGSGGNITVPSTLDGYPVTAIDDAVFIGNSTIGDVVIEDGITSIGVGAFLSSSVTTVVLPESLVTLKKQAFESCTSLTSISISAANENFKTVDGVLYNKDGSNLIVYPAGKTNTTFAVPEGTTSIIYYAFKENTYIQTVTLPEGLGSIDYYAFVGCTSLSSINLPSSLYYLAMGTFKDCTSLTAIAIPEGITQLRSYTFGGCSSLNTVTLPSTLTKLGSLDFWACENLVSITIPEGVTSIGNQAFQDCWALTTVSFPSTLVSIGENAFERCPMSSTLDLPDGLSSLGESAFYQASQLQTVSIPTSVTELASNVFGDCSNIDDITIYNPDIVIAEDAFSVSGSGVTMTCYYESTAYWYGKDNAMDFEFLPDSLPLDEVTISADKGEFLYTESTPILITASAEKHDATVENVEYRFLYKKDSSTRWAYISKAFSENNSIEFNPTAEGTYTFKVEARTSGRSGVDVTDESGELTVYINTMPAESVAVAVTNDKTQFQSTETVPLEVTAVGNGEDDMEYLVEFSTNGKKYKTLVKGEEWHAFVPTSGNTMVIDQTLPTTKKDTEYYIRVSVRSEGRTEADVTDIIKVKVYTVMPLESVTLDSVGNDDSSQIIPETGITLEATAVNIDGYEETPTYRFSYRVQGSTKWVYINKAFSEADTVQFVPKSEGVYYFKVEALSLGRKSKTGDASDYDYTSYILSNTAEPVKGIYNLTSDEKDYLNGDAVTLTMDITQNDAGDDVEYQLLYSTNGKSFKAFDSEYSNLTIASGEATINVPALPDVKKDTIYYLKVQVRTVGRNEKDPDAYAITQVEFKTAEPIEEGEIVFTTIGDGSTQMAIGEGVLLEATDRANTEYRFAYQMLGSTKWSYISSKWSTENSITFVPKKEGLYQLKVEARAVTRTTTDTEADSGGYYGFYYGSLGVESAEITDITQEFDNGEAGVTVPIRLDAEGNGGDTYDLQISYSTNGKKYTVAEGFSWHTFGPEATTDMSTTIDLPAVTKDTHFYIKLEATTTGHTTTDTYDIAEVDVYVGEPLSAITSFVSDAASGIKLLEATTDTLTLTALANDDATYKFYYRLEGATKWSAIPTKSVVENQAYFRPKTEGTYEFKVEATAEGRSTKGGDVSEELGEAIDIWFTNLPAEAVDMGLLDADNDYIIGTDTEMTLQLEVTSEDDDMDYQIVYSTNNGKSYKTLSAWQPLVYAGSSTYTVTCPVPSAKKDTSYLIKAQIHTEGRTGADVESETVEIWMLAEEREVTTTLNIPLETYEYTEVIMTSVAISEPASGTVEYQLQYSTDNKKWYNLAAHDWTVYNDMGYGAINVGLNLSELNGETFVYVKLNARMENGTKIEDYSVDSFMLYNIAPVQTAELTAMASGDEYITLSMTADDGGYDHDKEYRYSYALAGQSKTKWVTFTSWVDSSSITFTPSLTGDYLFKAEARTVGRTGVDVTQEATNDDSGYYLKSIEDAAIEAPEPTPNASPSPSAVPSASAEASATPEPSVSAKPSATTSEETQSSLEYAQGLALGEGCDISAYVEIEVLAADLAGILAEETAPIILVQTGEETYAVITGYTLDEAGALISLTLADQTGEVILGGTEGIVKAWYYALSEPEVSPSAVVSPSASSAPSASPEASTEVAPEASQTPMPAASENPTASENPAASESTAPIASESAEPSATPAA